MRKPFQPLPFLDNPHVQTLLKNLMPAPRFRHASLLRHVALPDGDQLAIHDTVPSNWRPGDPIVLIAHGLSGCHRSTNVVALANLLAPRGFRVVRLDLRGAGAGESLARSSYNAGCSNDVRAAVVAMNRLSPDSPMMLVGFSLGGNIVLKLAGEAAVEPLPRLDCVAAISPPIDMVRCAALLERADNRLYDAYFTDALVRQALRRQRIFPDLPPIAFPRRLRLRMFDELYTAPRCGFGSAMEYYIKSSALPLLPRIGVPTLLLTARDDPFICVEAFDKLEPHPLIEVHVTERGGHLGFIGRDGKGGCRWAETQVADWLLRLSGVMLNTSGRKRSQL